MPDWKHIVRERLGNLKLPGASESEVFDELSHHLEDRYQELLASGVSESEAQRIAIEPLNANPSLVEALRRARNQLPPEPPARRAAPLAFLLYDVRMALRGMRQKPAFTLLIVGMLALGIGGNAAIFSTFNSLFLKPLPLPESGRLIDLDETAPQWSLHYTGISDPDYFAWSEHNTTFDAIAFFTQPSLSLSRMGPAQHIRAAKVTRSLLDVLQLKLVLGRNFLPEEDRPKGEKVVLLGYDLWQRLFSGERGVAGRILVLDNEPYKIVGVLPRNAVFPDRAELWVPLCADPNAMDRGWYGHGIGRLKRGVTAEQAAADLLRIHRAQINAGRKFNAVTSPILTSIRSRYLGDYRTASEILLVAVGVVLLIACVNIAALMLVRASARSHEIAIRGAIGASRVRIVQQLLAESAVLAAVGGIAGVLLGRLGLQAIVSLLPDSMPRWIDFHLDATFALFCVLISAAAALLFGLVPAWQGSRADLRGALHESSLRGTLSRGRRGLLDAMVVSEIGLALALLISSGLILRAFYKVTHVDPGFRSQGVLTFNVDVPQEKFPKAEQSVAFYRNLIDQVRTLPGVVSAAAATAPPLGGHMGQFFEAEGDLPLGPNEKTPVVLQVAVTPGYFDTIGIRLRAGRQFEPRDGELKDHPVAVVNETFARQHWPTTSAVGKRIRYQDPKAPWWEVIGVVHNEKHYGLDGEDRPSVYMLDRHLRFPMSMSLVVRAQSNPERLVEPARRILERIDPDLPMYAIRTMTEQLDRSLWARRAYSWLFSVFSFVALLLAAAGVYGVISYAVSQRTQEIGIRMALGASPREVLASVLRGGMALVAAGAVLGVAAALAAATLLEKLLFGVSPRDPLVYAAVVLGVAAVGFLANAIPARRAAALDPMRALRAQ